MNCTGRKFLGLAQYLNERSRRVWAALEARALGFGGVAMVARATGVRSVTSVPEPTIPGWTVDVLLSVWHLVAVTKKTTKILRAKSPQMTLSVTLSLSTLVDRSPYAPSYTFHGRQSMI